MTEGPTQGDDRPEGGQPGQPDPYAPPPAWGQPTQPTQPPQPPYGAPPPPPPPGQPYGAPPPYAQPPYAQPPYGAPPYATPPGQPPQGGYPPPYGYAGYGYPAPRENEQLAIWALVLSIAEWVLCPIIPGIVALILAGRAEAAIAASGGRVGGEGMIKAARIVTWVHFALIAVVILFVIVVAVAGGFANSSSS
jgi:hypothetical protein